MSKTFYQSWLDQDYGFTNQGSFCVSLMKCYTNADGDNRARLEVAFPEFFMPREYKPLPVPSIYLDDDIRENLLCSALEGGSNYWYYLPNDISVRNKGLENKKPFVTLIWNAINAGEKIPVTDINEDHFDKDGEHRLGYISLENIERGEKIMFEKHASHYADAKEENDDAGTADVWLQLAVMGEIVYG